MPPKNFRDNRPSGRLVRTTDDLKECDLVRPCGMDMDDYKTMQVCKADADWRGPLYVALETRRANTRTFVCEYGYEKNSTLQAKDGTVVFLGNDGSRSLSGERPVGVLFGNGHPKGPIVHLAPGQCVAVPPPKPKRKTRKKSDSEKEDA